MTSGMPTHLWDTLKTNSYKRLKSPNWCSSNFTKKILKQQAS